MIFTRAFWKDTAERVVASAAGGFLVAGGGDLLNVFAVDWKTVTGVTVGTGLFSLAKALIASRVNDPQSASLVDLPGQHAAPEL